VYVKIHHPSDVVAGALLGVVLARIARRAWRFPPVVQE
jgi:membrane-associated phospholipid phosphatase